MYNAQPKPFKQLNKSKIFYKLSTAVAELGLAQPQLVYYITLVSVFNVKIKRHTELGYITMSHS